MRVHDSALSHGKLFFDQYVVGRPNLKVVDIGSQDVNGSLRSVCPADVQYIGVDFQHAKGVDILMVDPYQIPIESGTVDVCVSSSCFEHSEFFWVLFLEVLRILKPSGLLYLNAPSNGSFHRYPVDCWRFYPDSGLALQNWARRNGTNCALLESFIGAQQLEGWNDCVAVFAKDEAEVPSHQRRMLDKSPPCTNARRFGSSAILNHERRQEDQSKPAYKRVKSKVERALSKLRKKLRK